MGQVGRRRFLTVLGASALTSPLACLAQRPATLPRIGVLSDDTDESKFVQVHRQLINESLGRAGYSIGRDIELEWRFAQGSLERMRALVEDLVRLKVNVIVTLGSGAATYYAKRATETIPIVMWAGTPDVADRYVTNYARPGGNVTGSLWRVDDIDFMLKQSEILKQAAPSVVRVAVLTYDPRRKSSLWPDALRPWQLLAIKSFGFDMTNFAVDSADEISSTLDRIAQLKPDALHVIGTGPVRTRDPEIAAFAIREKLISISTHPWLVYEGGLLYYGPDAVEIVDRTVSFVDRILRGANPGDLPIELPAKSVLLFNAKTARAIRYTPPPELLLRVTNVVE